MKIAVLGMGYVGSVTAAVLAREGHQVTGVEINADKAEMLARGVSPVLEPGLPELVRRVHLAGRLAATSDVTAAVAAAEVAMICVGTPSAPSGALDGAPVARVAAEIGPGLAAGGYRVVVVRSTVTPDVLDDVLVPALEHASGRRVGDGFGLVINPEFLREGTALRDFDQPEFTLLGTDEPRAAAILERMYGFLSAPVVVTDRRTATLVKYACNAFHALKVAFANEIGALGRAAGVDGREVMRLICLDRRLNLSAAYLTPGMPFGGSCLPKDLRAMLHYGRRRDLPVSLLAATLESNRLETEACVERILAHGRVRVGFLGLAFKAGTDDLRESPTIAIIERLLGKGIPVAIYDRRVTLAKLLGANREYVARHLPHIESLLRPTLDDVLGASDVIVIANGDDEFRTVPARLQPGQALIDLVGDLEPIPPAVRAFEGGAR